MNNAFVLMFDDGYFNYAKACINSIQDSHSAHPVILIFYDGSDKTKIAYLASIKNLRLMPYERDYGVSIGLDMETTHLGIVNNPKVYFKFILWTSLFNDFDNILYLDADTLVLKPLDKLFEQQDFYAISDNNTLAGCGLFYPQKSKDPELLSKLEEDGLSYPGGIDDMINAGVFLIPRKYRDGGHLIQLLEICRRYNESLMFADQSAISLWCHLNGIPIRRSFEFNFQPCFFQEPIPNFDPSDIHIAHFTWWKPDGKKFLQALNNAYHLLLLAKDYKRYLDKEFVNEENE